MIGGPKHFTWADKSKNDFLNQLSNPDTIHQIENITSLFTNDPIKMVSSLMEILIKNAKEAKVKKVEKRKIPVKIPLGSIIPVKNSKKK